MTTDVKRIVAQFEAGLLSVEEATSSPKQESPVADVAKKILDKKNSDEIEGNAQEAQQKLLEKKVVELVPEKEVKKEAIEEKKEEEKAKLEAKIEPRKIEPLSVEEAKTIIKKEMEALIALYHDKMTFVQKAKTFVYKNLVQGQLSSCKTPEKLTGMMKELFKKLEELKKGSSQEDVVAADIRIETIRALEERLLVSVK